MNIEIRDNKLHISGYVNAVERDSLPIMTKRGECVEQIKAGAFAASMADGHEIRLCFNHKRAIGSTADDSLRLREDNIGLYAEAETADEEIRALAAKGALRGWSFGFTATDDDLEERSGDIPRRHVKALDLSEVSVLSVKPAYNGNSLEYRSEDIEYRSYDIYKDTMQTVTTHSVNGEIKSITEAERTTTEEGTKTTSVVTETTTSDNGVYTETHTNTSEWKEQHDALKEKLEFFKMKGWVLEKRMEQRELEQRAVKSDIEAALYMAKLRGELIEQGRNDLVKKLL